MELKTYPILSVQCFRRCSATPDQEGFPSKTQCLGAEVVDYNFDIVYYCIIIIINVLYTNNVHRILYEFIQTLLHFVVLCCI